MGERNKKSPEIIIDITNSEKKEIAKGNSLAVLKLSKEYKKNFKYINYIYLEKYFKKSWIKDKLSINDSIFGNNSADKILSEKLFQDKNLHQAIFEKIETSLSSQNMTLENLESLEITSGILVVRIDNGGEIAFDLSAISLEKLVVKQQIQEVKKDVEKSVVDYFIGGTIFTLTFGPTVKHELERGKRMLQKLIFTENGVKYFFEINQELKANFNEVDLINILEKKGVQFNPETNKFEFKNKLDSIKYSSVEKALKKWKYTDYTKQMEIAGISDIKSEAEFKKLKKESRKFIDELRVQKGEISFGKSFFESFEKIGGKAMHYILLPIFLQELHKNSGSDASYIASVTEVIGFMGGAALGGRMLTGIGIRHPFVLLAGSLVAGGLGAVLGEEGLHHYDKKILKYLPNKDIEPLQKNIDIHLLTGGSIYDFLDTINLDVWDGFIDMTNNINLGTSPEVYLSKRFGGVDHWNKELDEYITKTSKKIDTFLKKDFKYTDVLKEKDYFDTAINIFSSSFEEKLYNIVQYKDGSRAIHYEKKAKQITKNIISFMELNLDNIYIGDKESFDKFLAKLKIELQKDIKNKDNIEKILGYLQYYCEEVFNEEIGNILGSEGMVINDLQKESIKDSKKILFHQYHYSKKEENSNNKKKFIKDLIDNKINENRIDLDYIDGYKETVQSKQELINLALEGKLSDKQEEGKYLVIINENKSFVPRIVDGKIEHYSITEDVKDLLFISKSSKKNRLFIKEIIYNKISIGKNPFKLLHPTLEERTNIEKFKKLLVNPGFHYFYKRILIVQKQKSFITNIEKNGDAVEWNIENSILFKPISYVSNKVSNILGW